MNTTSSLMIFILANVCLFMMISTSIADQFVIDTNGEPVEEGDEYFIRPPSQAPEGSLWSPKMDHVL
jgi:hypothetical protein